jgi:hypothetical protein
MKNALNFKLLLLTAVIFMLTISACRKNDQPVFTEATIINGGVVAADGCGWLIRIGDTYYSPTNLADPFKETELKVSIRYQALTTKFECGWGQKIPEIKLLEIKKR